MNGAPDDGVPWEAFPTEAEAAELTRTNPKGVLWEFCARAKCPRPKRDLVQRGTVHGCSMRLHTQGRALASPVQWAWDRTLAEQMAARFLLRELAIDSADAEPGELVTAEEAERFRLENPKGSLLEQTTLLRIAPVFDVHPVTGPTGGMFEGSAHVEVDGDELWSDIRRAPAAKLVEHAAAASLLARLRDHMASRAITAAAAAPARAPASSEVSLDPRSLLNELRQKGRLRDFGFHLVHVEGPPHAPVFRCEGFAVRASGERFEVTNLRATSKREGEREVARALVAHLAGDRP